MVWMDAWKLNSADGTLAWFLSPFVKSPSIFSFHSSYQVYRTVLDYYSSGQDSEEDAYDMRKALSRDKEKRSMIPLKVGRIAFVSTMTIVRCDCTMVKKMMMMTMMIAKMMMMIMMIAMIMMMISKMMMMMRTMEQTIKASLKVINKYADHGVTIQRQRYS